MSDEMLNDEEMMDEDEVVFLPPGEEAPAEEEEEKEDEATLALRKELEELRAKSSESQAIREGIESLGKTLRPQQSSQAPHPSGPQETPEERMARYEKELFTPGKTSKTLQEMITNMVGPSLYQARSQIAEQSKKLLELDPEKGEYYKRFKSEVEDVVSGWGPQAKADPTAYNRALDQVLAGKPELEEERLNAKVEEMVAQRLKELGVEGDTPTKKKSSGFREGASSGGSIGAKKKTKYISASEREELEKEAALYGMDVKDYVQYMK